MRLRNMTRRREIGANSYLLEAGNSRVVLDSGMHPKAAGFDALPDFGPLPHKSANAILITHAHHDHIGSLPVLQRRQSETPVLMTEVTGELSSAMLHNSVNVMTKQREEESITEYPLFTHRELDQIRANWIYRDIERPFTLPDTDLEATMFDAGHILGSTGILIREGSNTLFYTGDVNFEPQTICRAADFPASGIDVLMIETTRGEHARPEEYSRKGEKERLAALIRDTHEANGALLIPVFALGKTQEVMLMLHELHQEGLIPEMPLYIGGLSTKITVLYDHYASRSRRNYPGFRLLEDTDILVPRKGGRKRQEIVSSPRTLYALSSGMMTEHTASNQFAWKFLDNPRNSVAFVGYTDPESPGYKIRTAKNGDMIKLARDLPAVPLRARVESFDLSAHATREQIADYAEKVRPKKMLLVHGEEASQQWFMRRFAETIPDTEIIRPDVHQPIDLW
ncbi:MAG: MBL fold metallo-hydrolase [Verrucomicrobiaceae bacterium]|nr:MBL fold metallo-hydrolase [Verrucomicrobiaceae bacterium]